MFRKLCTLGLALMAVTVATAVATNTVLIDDFSDGDDTGWSHLDTTDGTPWGPAIYDASDGSYTLESAGAVPADDINTGAIIATWEGSRGRPRFANGAVRGKVRANTPGTTAGFVLRANDEVHTDYGFFGSASFGTFYIERFDGSLPNPQTIIAMADPNEAPFAAGEDWYFEAGAVGNHLWLKVWKVGEPEPARPLLSLKDKTLRPGSGSLICCLAFFDPAAIGDDAVEVSAKFDDITFTHKAPKP
jgi:hypothetical protein